MKTRTLISSLAVVALLAMSAVSYAGPHGQGRGFYNPASSLTAEQQAALKTAYEAYAKQVESVGQDLYAKNLELEAELAKAAPDAKRVSTLTKEVNELRGKVFEQQVAFRAKLAKDFGIRGGAGCGFGAGMGPGMGYGMGPGMGRGMMGGYGPNCQYLGPDTGDKDN